MEWFSRRNLLIGLVIFIILALVLYVTGVFKTKDKEDSPPSLPLQPPLDYSDSTPESSLPTSEIDTTVTGQPGVNTDVNVNDDPSMNKPGGAPVPAKVFSLYKEKNGSGDAHFMFEDQRGDSVLIAKNDVECYEMVFKSLRVHDLSKKLKIQAITYPGGTVKEFEFIPTKSFYPDLKDFMNSFPYIQGQPGKGGLWWDKWEWNGKTGNWCTWKKLTWRIMLA